MLQAIRDKTKGWIAYVIIAVIAIPFALFGVYNYFTGGSDPTVAEVGGYEITRSALDRSVQQTRSRLRRQLGDRFDQFMAATGEKRFRESQLQQLINQQLLQQYADSGGIRVSAASLRSGIEQIAAFQREGEFSREIYERYLRGQGLSAAQFERRYRQSMTIQRLEQAVRGSTLTTQAELSRIAALQFQERDVGWLAIDVQGLAEDAPIDEAAIEAYYQANKSQFQRPRQVRVAYVELTQETVAAGLEISEARLRKRYEELKDTRFGSPPTREVSHILLEVPADASEQEVEQTRKRLVELREQISSGKRDFAEAAKELSDDPGSARNGGDLGNIRKGDMPEAFEDAAFDLEKGELSEPVRTEFGWHLIRVDAISAGKTKPFAEVRDQLRASMAEQQARAQFLEQSNQLGNLVFENSESLQPAADELGLEIQTSDWFSADAGDGLGSAEAVREAAFSPDVLQDGYNSAVLELGEGRRAVVRVTDQRPAKTLSLDAVRDRVEAQLRRERGRERAEALAKELRGTIAEGRSADALANKRSRVELSDAGWVTRSSNGPPPAVVQEAFQMPRPQDGQTAVGLAQSARAPAVVLLRGVRDGELADLSEEQINQLRQRLGELDARSSWQDVIAALRERADITINRGRL